MASKPLSIGPFPQGMNNRLPDSQLKLGQDEGGGQLLRDAVNVDVTARGTLKRRAGATLAHAGLNCHSGWSPRDGAFMLYADAGDLFRLDFKPDGTAAREQIAAGYPIRLDDKDNYATYVTATETGGTCGKLAWAQFDPAWMQRETYPYGSR